MNELETKDKNRRLAEEQKFGKQPLIYWLKTNHHPIARFVRWLKNFQRDFELPGLGIFGKVLYFFHKWVTTFFSEVMRIFYYTPIFKSQLLSNSKGLYLYGGIPTIVGSLKMNFGNNIELAARTTLSGRTASSSTPLLRVDDGAVIGWHCRISVGTKIHIGERTYLASGCHLIGHAGHPIEPKDRYNRKPDTDEQCGDIILGKNVWLGTGVTVMPGVTIGENTVIGAKSVVTRSLPANVLAAGVPAKVVRSIV